MSTKQTAVLVLSGSFNPPTNAHISLLTLARRCLEDRGFIVVCGRLVPTHGAYSKPGLASSAHRVAMCRLCVDGCDWLDVDSFEVDQPSWTDCLTSLRHQQGLFPGARVFYICGSDLVMRWNEPVWPDEEVIEILNEFGVCVFARNLDINEIAEMVPILKGRLQNVVLAPENPMSGVSSTLVREMIKKKMRITGLVPVKVENYIRENDVYGDNILNT